MSTTNANAGIAASAQKSESEPRPYVVLEQGSLQSAIEGVLKEADVGLNTEEWAAVVEFAGEAKLYTEIARVPARNAAHALRQVGHNYAGVTVPPLVAVSERMFKARKITVTLDPRVSVA